MKQKTDKRKASEAQKRYWQSLRGKKCDKAPNWKGENAGKQAMHQWLAKYFGKPTICEICRRNFIGKWLIDWALKKDRKYSHSRGDYQRLCKSCHRKYDMTEVKKQQAIKNLSWFNKE